MNYFDVDMTPPPIVTFDVDTDDDTIKEVLKRLLKSEFSLKCLKGALYLYTETKDDYDILIQFLQFHNHGYYTYRAPWDTTQLIVLRGYLGNGRYQSKIIADLKKKGIICLRVDVINRRPDEFYCVARLLTLEKNANLDYVRNIRTLGNIGGITWEDYVVDKYTPLQCSRCQRFRHDSRFCYMPPNCKTCGNHYLSKKCKHSAGNSIKCFNCQADHPANDSWCPEWTSYKTRLASARVRAERK